MKLIKKYQLPGLPLVIDQGKLADHLFYVGGFPDALIIIDDRLSTLATKLSLNG